MKYLKWFVYLTAIITAVGFILLLNDGDLTIYEIWGSTALFVAVYLINKK